MGFGQYEMDEIVLAIPAKRRRLLHRRPVAQPPAPAATNLFDKLAIEINQNIASFLEYDQDICNFQLISRSTRDAVEGDNCTFWRRRFLEKFEKPNWTDASNARYKAEYQKRRSLLKNGAVFKNGNRPQERQCLEMLAQLVAESYAGQTNANYFLYECKNMEHIKRFFLANNLLQIIGEPLRYIPRRTTRRDSRGKRKRSAEQESGPEPENMRPTTLLQAVQIIAAPMLLSLEDHVISHHFGFPDSQRQVYSSRRDFPIFTAWHGRDVNINMPFILHNLNFWKYHMTREVETTLYYPFSDLEDHHLPQWWTSQPKCNETNLPTHWKGSYAYVNREEIASMRKGHAEALEIQDRFAGEDTAFSFQDMKLSLVTDGVIDPWPEVFERILHARHPRPVSGVRTRAQQRNYSPTDATSTNEKRLNFRFEGSGQDVSEAFLTSGWMNSLPAHHGIPGWNRVTMMKYFEDEDGTIDQDALWAYEGVVLPGGKIMLGRWWSVADEQQHQNDDGEEGQGSYSGPFILWAVDKGA